MSREYNLTCCSGHKIEQTFEKGAGRFRYLQLDDWWYPGKKSIYVHCVRNWSLGEPAFSRSLGDLSKRVQTPWLLYVPFFCPDNVYAAKYKFVQGAPSMPGFAEPDPADGNALEFYRELFDRGAPRHARLSI